MTLWSKYKLNLLNFSWTFSGQHSYSSLLQKIPQTIFFNTLASSWQMTWSLAGESTLSRAMGLSTFPPTDFFCNLFYCISSQTLPPMPHHSLSSYLEIYQVFPPWKNLLMTLSGLLFFAFILQPDSLSLSPLNLTIVSFVVRNMSLTGQE